MAVTERLALIIDADSKGAVRELEKVGKTAERELGKAETSIEKFGSKLTSTGTVMMAGAAVVGAALWNASQATSDLNEAADYSGRVFGEAAGEVEAFADGAAKIGLSKRAALEATSTFADLLKATGATKDELADMSIEMATLSSDMASAKNTTPEDAIEALGAALRGESEPIRRYGVMLDDATLKQRALDEGLIETTTGTLPMSIKMQAAYAEILAQTAGMQGNYMATADGAANKTKNMAADIENAKATIGEGFLPVMSAAIGLVADAAETFSDLDDKMGGAIGQTAAVGTVVLGVGGAAALATGQVMGLVRGLQASAEAGSALAASTLAALGPLAIVGASLAGVWAAYTYKVNEADDAMQDMADTIDSSFAGDTSFEDFIRRQNVLIEEHNRMIDESGKGIDIWNNAERQAMKDASHETGKRIEANNLLIDTVSELSRTTGESTDSAMRWYTEQQNAGVIFTSTEQALKLYNTQVEASGGKVGQTTEQQAKLNKQYEDAVADLDKLIAKIDAYYGALDGTTDLQVGWEAAIDNMTSTLAENGTAWDWVAGRLDITTEAGRENLDALRGQRDAAVDFGQALLDEGKGIDEATAATLGHVEALKQQWRQAGFTEAQVAVLVEQMGLTPEAVTTAFNQPGLAEGIAGANNFKGILDGIPRQIATEVFVKAQGAFGLFGKAQPKAEGGPVSAGLPYLVGERGPELVVPGQSGTVVPAAQTAALMAGGGGQTPVVNVYIGNEQVQARVESGLLTSKRQRTGWKGIGS